MVPVQVWLLVLLAVAAQGKSKNKDNEMPPEVKVCCEKFNIDKQMMFNFYFGKGDQEMSNDFKCFTQCLDEEFKCWDASRQDWNREKIEEKLKNDTKSMKMIEDYWSSRTAASEDSCQENYNMHKYLVKNGYMDKNE